MVNTGDWQFSQLSFTTLPVLGCWGSSRGKPWLGRRPTPGTAVRDDSKLGMVGTEGKGETLPSGLKSLANSFLEGSCVERR
jgi:hypothetical protein